MDRELLELLYKIGNIALVPLTGILAALGAMAVQKIKLFSMSIKGTKLEQIKLNATISVQSSQQKYNAKMITNKKEAAIETMKKLCREQNLNVPDSIISELIESSVWEDIKIPAASVTPPLTITIPPVTSPVHPVAENEPSDITPLG
jgi:hypothetical protein